MTSTHALEAAATFTLDDVELVASSGKTTRHRLTRGGDRAANSALHKIAIARLATDPDTRAYAARLTAAGKTKKDILRCLKRAIARQVFHLITNPRPAANSSDIRPARKRLGLALTDVADGLHCATSKTSLIERGTTRDTRFLNHHRAWLTTQQHAQIAA